MATGIADADTAVGSPSTLTFFCELEAEGLAELFSNPSVIRQLVALNARVSLGILDFSPERAEVVRRLNRAGVPAIAWQLLPKEQGYWYNMCNAHQAAIRYAEFSEWSERTDLQWSAIGIDIEPDIAEFQQLLGQKAKLIRTLLLRLGGKQRLCDARDAYQTLISRMQSDGYPVNSYEFPFMLDEQRAGSSLVHRILGIAHVPSDLRVLMLYTSFFRPYGPAFLWSYARDAASVGVGITGGGVEIEGVRHPDPLSWNELARDLRLAAARCRDIHVFSLEGCVRQGFLDRLRDFTWAAPVQPPRLRASILNALRSVFRGCLWLTCRPALLLVVLAGLVGLLVF